MTEAEWLECKGPQKMLEFLQGKVSERKLRLFDCSCCRLVWQLLDHAELELAVEAGEQFADGLIDYATLAAAGAAAEAAEGEVQQDTESVDSPAHLYAAWAATEVADGHAGLVHRDHLEPYRNVAEALANRSHPRWYQRQDGSLDYGTDDLNWPESKVRHRAEALARMAALLRDIFANPFRPIAVNPSWLTAKVVRLAQAVYEERAFDNLPTLAEALEEAGCQDREILGHCRLSGEHARGCWVIDLVLGKK
jgi:hypothetical protein